MLGVLGRECLLRAPRVDEEVVALTEVVLVRAEPNEKQLFEALHDREESLAILAMPRHADRVRAKLLQLARMHGKVTPTGVAIAFPLTHELLADMTVSARETVTLALRELTEAGFVRREGRYYVVSVPPEELAQDVGALTAG